MGANKHCLKFYIEKYAPLYLGLTLNTGDSGGVLTMAPERNAQISIGSGDADGIAASRCNWLRNWLASANNTRPVSIFNFAELPLNLARRSVIFQSNLWKYLHITVDGIKKWSRTGVPLSPSARCQYTCPFLVGQILHSHPRYELI